jgi:alpha-maltose-1-phosphate synthase
MRIGFLTSEYPHELTGSSAGIGSSIRSLAMAFVKLGHDVTVFIYSQKDDNSFNDGGIKIIQIKNLIFRGFSWFLTRKKIQKVINRHIDKNGLDIIEAPDWTGITAFVKLKCPVIVKVHGSDTYFCHLDNRPVKKMSYILERKALKDADAHISVSSYAADLTNELFDLNIDFKIIHNGIELRDNNYNPDNDDNQTILYVGTLIRKKGALELPLIFNEVMRQNPGARLLIAGRDTSDKISGNFSTWTMMQKLFDPGSFKHVYYMGEVPHSEIDEVYKQAMVCIFPSFAEAFPVTWLEAMSFSRPIVAYNIGWATEVVENEITGILCKPGDNMAFARDINRLLSDKSLGRTLGCNSRERVEKLFVSEKIANETVRFYNNILYKWEAQ